MSEEYAEHEHTHEHEGSETFSPFWPLLILLVGLVLWAGYQVYAANSQRSVYSQQFQTAVPTINQAQLVQDRYVKLMKDLLDTSSKDAQAAQIVHEAMAAGWIRQQAPAAGAPASGDTNSAPAAPDSSAPPASGK